VGVDDHRVTAVGFGRVGQVDEFRRELGGHWIRGSGDGDSVYRRGLRAMVNAVHKVNASQSLFRCRSEV